ncbi:MAG: hypothetical protein R3C01_18025, partial [Planctomycetaceae bacterium]
VTGLPEVPVIVGVGVVSIGYTMMGGLRAVMWTDVIQFFVFTLTILVTLGLVLSQTESSLNDVFSHYFSNRQHLVVDFSPSLTLQHGSWAILVGVFLEALSAFGADQVAVQRYLSARSERTSQVGALLNLLGMWIVVPGLMMIGVALYSYYSMHPGELGDGTLSEVLSAFPKIADKAMPTFVKTHFPPGLAGLFLAALLAAIMSSIDSGIHSVTTVLVVDLRDRLAPHLRPKTEQGELTFIRLLVITIGTIAITLACNVSSLGNVFDIGKKLTAAFGGPLLAIFLLAFFSRRANTVGVFLSVILATGVTLAFMYSQSNWYSVWFWPIGFGLALGLGLLLGCLGTRSYSGFTYYDIMRRHEQAIQKITPQSFKTEESPLTYEDA